VAFLFFSLSCLACLPRVFIIIVEIVKDSTDFWPGFPLIWNSSTFKFSITKSLNSSIDLFLSSLVISFVLWNILYPLSTTSFFQLIIFCISLGDNFLPSNQAFNNLSVVCEPLWTPQYVVLSLIASFSSWVIPLLCTDVIGILTLFFTRTSTQYFVVLSPTPTIIFNQLRGNIKTLVSSHKLFGENIIHIHFLYGVCKCPLRSRAIKLKVSSILIYDPSFIGINFFFISIPFIFV